MQASSNVAWLTTTFSSLVYNAERLACVTTAEYVHVHSKQQQQQRRPELHDVLNAVGNLFGSPEFWLIVNNEDALLSRTLYDIVSIIGAIGGSHKIEDHAAIKSQHVHSEVTDAVALYKQSAFTQVTNAPQIYRLSQLFDNLERMSANNCELKDSAPPAYNEIVDDTKLLDTVDEKLPGYEGSGSANNDKAERELHMIVSAVDRFSNITPQLNNQRVCLTERQKKEFALAAAAEDVPRRKRNDQRALILPFKYTSVYQLFAQIVRSATRRFDNRRMPLNVKLQQRKLDSATDGGLLETVDRGRRATEQVSHIKQPFDRFFLIFSHSFSSCYVSGLVLWRETAQEHRGQQYNRFAGQIPPSTRVQQTTLRTFR